VDGWFQLQPSSDGSMLGFSSLAKKVAVLLKRVLL
jgi:hypothetical protein